MIRHMHWARFALGFLVGPLLLHGCGRDDLGQGITISVISEISTTDPFTGEMKTTRQPASGANVYLAPARASRSALGNVNDAWRHRAADESGVARFGDVEGEFKAVVDSNGDGIAEGISKLVASGGKATVVLVSGLNPVENNLAITLDQDSYHRGDTVSLTLKGTLSEEKPVAIEVWRDGSPRTKMLSLPAKTFSGDVTFATTFTIGDAWPFTPAASLDDYLVVPAVQENYFTGARFSLRPVPKSVIISGMSVLIDSGMAVTTSPNATLTLTAINAASLSVSENPVALQSGTLIKYPYNATFAYQLSAGDGVKTVWTMFYDAEGNFAGPVSDSIVLDTRPAQPVTNLSLLIDGGVTTTTNRSVTLTLGATNAVLMAVTENPALFPDGVSKFIYAPTLGYQLSNGDGPKVVWAMYYDAYNHYYGPVSAAIELDTAPAPITNKSITINGGDNETNSRNVILTFTADNASFVAVSEDPSRFPGNVVRYGFQPSLGFQMSATEGTKTIWAMFYDQWGNASAPVSDAIQFDTRPPFAPDVNLMYVIPFAPGMHDFVAGYPGAVSGGNIVRFYSDMFLTNQIGEGPANTDGSFGPLDIGDGSAGNVQKPQDWIFVTATNIYDNTSRPSILVNDSTPPEIRETDVQGYWFIDTLGPLYGNIGDSLKAFYTIPFDFAPATDAVGGTVDFSQLGGPAMAAMFTAPTEFAAFFTVPPSLVKDANLLYLRMQIHDAAYNYSAWVTSGANLFNVDTVPPDAAVIPAAQHNGNNLRIDVQWREANKDTDIYVVTVTDETGATWDIPVDDATYCGQSANLMRSCAIQQLHFDPGVSLYSGRYPLSPLPNCHTYQVLVRVVDDGGNYSPYSNSISDQTSIPPPTFSNWSGLMEGTAMIAFGVAAVPNATAYELDFSTATGAPYSYAPPPPALYQSPYTTASGGDQVMRFPGLPTDTTFFVSARSLDASSGTCYSAYAAEATTRTELVVRAYADGASRETVGGSLAKIKDLNGDGITDLLVGSPFPQYVATVSGGTGKILSTFGTYWAPDSYDIPGTPIATAQLDGGAEDEFIIGSPLETVNGELLAGIVRIYDHDQTTVLKEFTGASLGYPSNAGMQLGFSVANVGDQNGDGYDEFAMGGFNCAHRNCGYVPPSAGATEGPGRVILIDGATLTAKSFLQGTSYSLGDYFGVAVAGGKDLGGSSAPEFAVGSPGSGFVLPQWQVTVYDGSTQSVRFQLSFATSPGSYRPGAALAFIDDISSPADGKADLIVGVPSISDSFGGYVVAVNSNGVELWRTYGDVVGASNAFGTVLATGGDINGDGFPDVVVGAPMGQQNFFYGAGSAYVLDGRTGRYLYEFHGWGDNGGYDGSVGQSALVPGNLIRGPRSEWVVGAPGSAYSGYQSGRIYILSTDP